MSDTIIETPEEKQVAAAQTAGKRKTPKRTAKQKPGSASPKTGLKTASSQKKAKTGQSKNKTSASPPPKKKQGNTAAAAKKTSAPAYKLLINMEEPEECRIALLEDGRVELFYVTTIAREQTKGNIYKGKIAAVEPNLQAAFVDIGTGKNGFLALTEIHPEYYYRDLEAGTHWKDVNINDVIRKGQEVLVQVVKEATGSKGANMTTYLSLPGRYMVLMPGSDSHGISRKISDDVQRSYLRKIIDSFKFPEGIGYIIRTASKGITKTAITKDFRYLIKLWQEIKSRGQEMSSPALIYKEQDILARSLRDHFTPDIQEIMVDHQEAFEQVNKFMDLLPARQKKTKVTLHKGSRPIFSYYNVEEQIEQIYRPKVNLPSGGSIVINPTEALVAIDVNSGRTAKDSNFEETIFLANMEAARELARQLRLRDLGGLIVVDFIDMREARHKREVEKMVKASMKRDKAKVDIGRISKFGLLQISRQKLASPIQMDSYNFCPFCQGRGIVRSVETQALVYLRTIKTTLTKKNIQRVDCRLPAGVAQYLLNKKRRELLELEKNYAVEIVIEADSTMKPTDQQIDFINKDQS